MPTLPILAGDYPAFEALIYLPHDFLDMHTKIFKMTYNW